MGISRVAQSCPVGRVEESHATAQRASDDICCSSISEVTAAIAVSPGHVSRAIRRTTMNDQNRETTPQPALTLMRVLRAGGLAVHRLQYQSVALQNHHRFVGDRSVQVRIDPTDIRQVFVWTGAKWIAASLKFNETAMNSVRAERLDSLQEYLIEVSAKIVKDARR
jgi:hypothetical protein